MKGGDQMNYHKNRLVIACLLLLAILIAPSGVVMAGDLLVEIQKRGEIKIGNTLTLPPFGMRNEKGDPIGFSVDFYRLIEEGLGVKVKIEDMAWAGLIPALLSGRIDAIGAPMLATLERAQKVIFTHAWFFTGTHANVRVGIDNPIKSPEELNRKGLKCAAIEGSIGEWVVRNKLPKCTPVILESMEDIHQALLTGRVDATFQDELIGKSLVDRYPNKIGQLDYNFRPVTYSFAVRPDLDSYHLKCWFDQFFGNIIRSGKYGEIYEKWTGKEFKVTAGFHGRP
jgi:ABC-type amino acid transport substrate-binding protein